jgi:hypothetical protein
VPPPDPFLVFTRKLDGLGLRYMISGVVAAVFYGEPRFTNDVDIVLVLRHQDAVRMHAVFPLSDFYCPPLEVLLAEAERPRRGHFNLIHHATGFKADLYLAGQDPLQAWGLARTRTVDFRGEPVVFAPPEYVIIKKLEFHEQGRSEKQIRDVQRMLIGLGEDWDRTELLRLVEEQRLQEAWARALGPTIS